MLDEDIRYHIENTEDYCALKRYNFSVSALREKYKEEQIPDKVIAAALKMTEDEVKTEYNRIIKKLKIMMIPDRDPNDI